MYRYKRSLLLYATCIVCFAYSNAQSLRERTLKNVHWFAQVGANNSVTFSYDAMFYQTELIRPYGGVQLKADMVYLWDALPLYVNTGIDWVNTNYQFKERASTSNWERVQNHVIGVHVGSGLKLRLSPASNLDFRAEVVALGFRHNSTKWHPVYLRMGWLSVFWEYHGWERTVGLGPGLFFGPIGEEAMDSWYILTLPQGNDMVPVDQPAVAVSLDFRVEIFKK